MNSKALMRADVDPGIKDLYLRVVAIIRSRLNDQLRYNLFLPQNPRLFINFPTFYEIICAVLSDRKL